MIVFSASGVEIAEGIAKFYLNHCQLFLDNLNCMICSFTSPIPSEIRYNVHSPCINMTYIKGEINRCLCMK